MDIEDEESSPVVTTPLNGNVPINPIMEQPAFISTQNGVRIILLLVLSIFVCIILFYRVLKLRVI